MSDFGSLGGISSGEGFAPNAQGVTDYLKDRLSRIRNFGSQLAELRKLGLNNSSLQEILAAGPEAGSQIATALLAEGKKAVSEVNSLERQIRAASADVGSTAASSEFGLSLKQAQGINNTTVNLRDGAVVINFGEGTSKSDAQAIERIVQQAIKNALKKAAQEAKR